MRGLSKSIVNATLVLGLVLASPLAWALKCDVDDNGRIDRVDLGLIQQAVLAQTPVSGPNDPRDADNNCVINSADGRPCALRCKYAGCATNGAPVANVGPDQTVRVGDTVTLSGAASSDPDGNPLTYPPDGRVTTYTYDAAGRLVGSEQTLDAAAGIKLVTDKRLDARDRPVVIAHSCKVSAGTPTLIAGQAIVRGVGGAVSRIDTFDSTAAYASATGVFSGNPIRVQTFGYDTNARLNQENATTQTKLWHKVSPHSSWPDWKSEARSGQTAKNEVDHGSIMDAALPGAGGGVSGFGSD